MKSSTNLSIFIMAAAICATAIVRTDAQDVPPCASKLVACLPYLNTTSKPSQACCFPLKMVIDDDLQCLCDLYKTAEFSGGNVTQAITLPARCGFSTDLSSCGTPGVGSPPPGSGAGTPPSPTGSPPSGAEKSIASAFGFVVLISFWVSIFLK